MGPSWLAPRETLLYLEIGDLSGLRAFVGKAPETRAGILAYNGTEALRIGPGLFAVPLGLLLS